MVAVLLLVKQAANFKFSFENSDKLVAYKIRESIKRKAENRYQEVDEVWLGIHQETELSNDRSIDRALKVIWVPKEHPFRRIFLVHRIGIGYRVVQFFPLGKLAYCGLATRLSRLSLV